jgi:hypothetical protein
VVKFNRDAAGTAASRPHPPLDGPLSGGGLSWPNFKSTSVPIRRETRVPEYRVRVIGTDGHFMESKEMICRDDGEAVVKAERLNDVHDIEIWSGNRLVISLIRNPK